MVVVELGFELGVGLQKGEGSPPRCGVEWWKKGLIPPPQLLVAGGMTRPVS